MARRFCAVQAALLLLVGCGDDGSGGSALRFVGLEDGDCASASTALFGTVPVRLVLEGDGELTRVTLSVNGGPPSEDSDSPFQLDVDTTQLPDGTATLEARGSLKGGGEERASIKACVDNAGPTLTLLSPGPGATGLKVEDAELTVRARATDPAGLEQVTATLAGGGSYHQVACTPPAGPELTCPLQPEKLALTLQPKQTVEINLVLDARDKLGRESRLERKLTLGSRLLWTHHVGAPAQWAPVVTSTGTVVVGTDAGTVVMVNPQTLQTSCTFTAPAVAGKADSVATPLTVSADGTRVYFATLNYVYAVSTSSCSQLWSAPGLHAASQPALDETGGVVYIGSYGNQAQNGALNAYNATTGTLLGSHSIAPLDGAVTSSPALSADGKRVYIGSSDFKLYAVDVTNPAAMATAWSYATAGKVESRPLVTANKIYVASSGKDRAIHAVDAQSGQRDSAFNFTAQAGFYSGPVLGPGGLIYAGSLDASLYALDANTGKTAATYATGRMLRAEPAFGPGGVVFAVSVDPGRLYAFSDKLKLLWSATPAGGVGERIKGSPTVAGTTVYIVTSNGYLNALDATAPAG